MNTATRTIFALILVLLALAWQPGRTQAQSSNPCPHRPPWLEAPCELAPQAYVALAYVATTYGVPIEPLWVLSDRSILTFPLIGRSVIQIYINGEDPRLPEYGVELYVDLADDSILLDIKPLQDAEKAAHDAKYGKYDPYVYERLQRIDDTTPVRVCISLGPRTDGKTELDFMRELAARYPQVQAALDQGLTIWQMEDPDLQLILRDYNDLLYADFLARAQPLVDALAAMGANASFIDGYPCVAVTLTKAQLHEIVQRSDVGYVDSLEAGSAPAGGDEPDEPLDNHLFLPLAL